jgi:DNA-binding HxlR family transcriptional regulator
VDERKSYGQFCGLARALDRIGQRWTLLIVRELLLGPRSFRDLEAGLTGISPALLSQRLVDLARDGLVARSDAPRRSKAVKYRLTDAGRELEPIALALIRWGSRWMVDGPGRDRTDPTWSPLALRALLEGMPTTVEGVVHLDVSGCDVTIAASQGRRSVLAGRHDPADADVAITLPLALAVAAGEMRLDETGAQVRGRTRVAAALLQPASDAGTTSRPKSPGLVPRRS